MVKSKRKVLFVVYSDLHGEIWKNHNEGLRRTHNAMDVMKRVKMVSKINKCPILFAGDLFHKEKHLSNKLLDQFLPHLSKMWGSSKYKTYAITGNHDQSEQNLIGNESPSYIRTMANTFKGIECIDFKTAEFETCVVHGIPYLTHDLGLLEYANKIKFSEKKVNILMLHTTIPETIDTDGREIPSHLNKNEYERTMGKFDIVITGHIHSPHSWHIGKTDIIQVGAPQQQRYTDRDCEMGYWLIFQDFSFEFVPMKKYPKFVGLERGESKPDNKNFYVEVESYKKKDKDKIVIVNNDFGNDITGKKLALNYCKEKKVKNPRKRKALIAALKNKDND